jgi:hypothetical protein
MSEITKPKLRRLSRMILPGLLLAAAQLGHANARAPLELARHGSEAATGTSVPGVVVVSEALDLSCSGESCRVTASYTFISERAAETQVRFVLPEREPLTVRVNDRETSVDVNALEPTLPPSSFGGLEREPRQRWQAELSANLAPGINLMVARYEQPLGLIETSSGYFRSSKFAQVFRYELWPLKEWTLADTFSLRIALTVPREPSFWDRLSEPAAVATCSGLPLDRGPSRSLALRRSLSEVEDRYAIDLDRRFPDTLECRIASPEATQQGRALFPDLTWLEERGPRTRS